MCAPAVSAFAVSALRKIDPADYAQLQFDVASRVPPVLVRVSGPQHLARQAGTLSVHREHRPYGRMGPRAAAPCCGWCVALGAVTGARLQQLYGNSRARGSTPLT